MNTRFRLMSLLGLGLAVIAGRPQPVPASPPQRNDVVSKHRSYLQEINLDTERLILEHHLNKLFSDLQRESTPTDRTALDSVKILAKRSMAVSAVFCRNSRTIELCLGYTETADCFLDATLLGTFSPPEFENQSVAYVRELLTRIVNNGLVLPEPILTYDEFIGMPKETADRIRKEHKWAYLMCRNSVLTVTVAHEMGHICLEHHDRLPDDKRPKKEVDAEMFKQEVAADAFAFRLLIAMHAKDPSNYDPMSCVLAYLSMLGITGESEDRTLAGAETIGAGTALRAVRLKRAFEMALRQCKQNAEFRDYLDKNGGWEKFESGFEPLFSLLRKMEQEVPGEFMPPVNK